MYADLTDTDIQEWTEAYCDDHLCTDEEIVSQGMKSKESCTEEEVEGEDEVPLQCVSSDQVADMLEQCLTWNKMRTEATATSLMLLKQMKRYSS